MTVATSPPTLPVLDVMAPIGDAIPAEQPSARRRAENEENR